jgi:ssDNA-binding Zn-finger/Zn-ribbon topoisomerase 1
MNWDNDFKYKALLWWQNSNMFHPLMCSNNPSCYRIMVPRIQNEEVSVICDKCGHKQIEIPISVFRAYQYHLEDKEYRSKRL